MPPNPNPRRPAPSNGAVADYRLLQFKATEEGTINSNGR